MSLLSTGGLASASARHPWRVVAIWVLAFVVGGYFASTIGDHTTTEATFLSNPESIQGLDLIEERMGCRDPLTETVIVASETLTVDDPAFQQVVMDTTNELRSLSGLVDQSPQTTFNYFEAKAAPDPAAAAAAEGLVSADRHTTLIP